MIEIRGYSDDIICISGDINEEFECLSADPHYIFCSDGTVIRAEYDGIWKLRCERGGSAQCFDVHKAIRKDIDTDEYSDVVQLIGDIEWVGYGFQLHYNE